MLGKVLVAVLFVVILCSKLDFATVRSRILSVQLWLLLLSTAIFCSRNVLGAYRLRTLLRVKGYTLPLMYLYKNYFVGAFFSFFLPTAVGGDIARGYFLHNRGVSKKEAASSIIVERVLGVSALIMLSISSIVLALNSDVDVRIKWIVLAAGICWLISLALLASNASTRLRSILPASVTSRLRPVFSVIEEIKAYGKAPKALAAGLGASLLFQGMGICSTFLLSMSVGCSIGFIFFLVLLPIVWLIAMIPISINGLGLREGAFVVLFASAGMTRETAITISILFLGQTVLQGLLGYLFFLFERKKR